MTLRIAFDLDGVLADMDGTLARHAEELFGEKVMQQPPDAAPADSSPAGAGAPDSVEVPALRLVLTPRQQSRLWQHVRGLENFWETLPELEPGIVRRLSAVAADRRWELLFLTKRPETAGATAQVQSQRWLEANGFALPSVYVVQRSRGRIAAALDIDVVVDDRPENCLDVIAESRARAILLWRDDERLIPDAARRLGIAVADSVAATLDVLSQVDASTTTNRAGLLGRVMRALGLKDDPARA